MARLFVSQKEHDFISSIAKEYTKDILGQYIIYYPISTIHTRIHPIYEEAVEKVFENPIKLDILAGQPERSQGWNKFGTEGETKIEIFAQAKDLIDKKINITAGDFFTYGNEVYEVINIVTFENIYGQAEYEKARKFTGLLSRTGQFDIEDFRQLLQQSKYFDQSSVQKEFVQQRGLAETEQGPTNDRREMRERLKDDLAEIALGEGPRKIAPSDKNDDDDSDEDLTNNFYHE